MPEVVVLISAAQMGQPQGIAPYEVMRDLPLRGYAGYRLWAGQTNPAQIYAPARGSYFVHVPEYKRYLEQFIFFESFRSLEFMKGNR